MKKIISVLFVIVLMISCNNKQDKKTITTVEEKITNIPQVDNSKFGRSNYAVVWKWTTKDVQLVQDNLVTIASETNNLWKKDVITDAYYNPNAKVDKLEYFPNISFFLKAKSYEEAEVILNKLTIVKKGIAIYTIYPVGTKWLGRNDEKINNKGITNSYVAVWTKENKEKLTDDLTKLQADSILKLWNEGTIENVYFDIEGTQKLNNKTDFVFFVNVNTEEEARKICDQLPFVKEKIASYKMHEVGVFWLGEFENK